MSCTYWDIKMNGKLNYQEYEKVIFNWLISKHKKDEKFTFSVRQNGGEDSKLDYFIGTEKSKYFGTTFWTLPVSFPGSSSDCIDLIFFYTKTGYNYFFEFSQTKSPHNTQNESALKLLQSVMPVLKEKIGLQKEPTNKTKMFTFRTSSRKNNYESIDEMIVDIDKDFEVILPIVDDYIEKEKKSNPDFEANRINKHVFDILIERMNNRFARNLEDISIEVKNTEDIKSFEITNSPLNQILYGPPGTGKTYNTVLEAVKIVTGNESISYDEALQVFNENLNNQIEFITFHQNYSYEDFIQGLRPDTENGKELSFEKKDGVFKRIADRALKNLEAANNPASAKKDFDVVFQELIQPLNEGDLEELEIKMKKSSFYITEVGEKSIEFRKNIGDSNHTLSITTLRKMYERGENDIILGGLQPYYNPILDLLLVKGKSEVIEVSRKNYVIIIDEINRANISRVFGELITLIEEDKRSHGKIPMRVTLPSGDSFIVPSNLYIIGTMNTADKSISLLDIALRRRFEFVPMYPNTLIQGVNSPTVLETINAEIIKRKGHDFTIGHAYFMGENYSLEKTINNKVIPLLLEYFMNDEKEVATILKAAEIEVIGWPMKMKTA